MTPTEQDKKIIRGIEKALEKSFSYQVLVLNKECRDELMQLITADRKRVALEAKIEAINYLDDNYQEDSQNWERDHPGYSTAMIPLEDYARYRKELGSQLSKSKSKSDK